MSTPFLAEIRMTSFGFAPKGWALCNGQLLPINQNQALFSLLGTTYGGDGRVTFALPDLRGRAPIDDGAGFTLGERGGEQAHTLSVSELPAHNHAGGLPANPTAATAGTGPGSNRFASGPAHPYRLPAAGSQSVPGTTQSIGGTQAHPNMQPFLTINFVIALQGIFPSSN